MININTYEGTNVMIAIVPDNEGTVDYFLNTNDNKWKKSCFHLTAGGFYSFALRLA